jgi:hypothetical protein
MFRTHITFEQDAVMLDDERVPFATIDDADVEEGVLVLKIASGTRRIKLKSSEAMLVLDGVLDGIERAHPQAPYRAAAEHDPNATPTPGLSASKRHMRRRTASVGSPDLMIGRTFTAG